MFENKALIFMFCLFGLAWAALGFDAGMEYGLFEASLLAAPGVALCAVTAVKLVVEIRRDRRNG